MGAEQFPPEFDLSGITQSVQCSGAAHYRITGCINIFIKVKRRFRDNIGVWCQPGGYSGISQHSGGGNRERQENGPPVPAEKRGRWRRQWWWRLFAFQILDIAVEHRVEQLLLFITAGEQRGEPRFELGRVVERGPEANRRQYTPSAYPGSGRHLETRRFQQRKQRVEREVDILLIGRRHPLQRRSLPSF